MLATRRPINKDSVAAIGSCGSPRASGTGLTQWGTGLFSKMKEQSQ